MSPAGVGVAVDVEGRTLRLTHLDKVLYPAAGTTKAEVLQYYAHVAPVLLPQLRDRAVTRIRWPHGVGGESFFEKNAPAGTPSWVRTVEVATTGGRGAAGGTLVFPVCDDLATLTWLANLSALELHVHQWRVSPTGHLRRPDRLVIDLDPGAPAGLAEGARGALLAREVLGERGLTCTPVASGSKGLHLYAPLPEAADAGPGVALAKEGAAAIQRRAPSLVTATMTRSRRAGKVFVDWSQNSPSKTTLVPYSLRGRARPPAAAPLTWDEVAAGAEDELALEQFTFPQVLTRLGEQGDLFAW